MSESLSFDRIAEEYDRTRGGEDRGRRFAGELRELFDPAEPVLEIGIGTALVARGLTEIGFRVLGVDLSEAMARRAVGRIGPRVVVGDALRLPMGDATVPQALSVWVLHVVGDLRDALAEVGRVLAPGGRYVVVPARGQNPGDPIGRAILELERRIDPDRRHSDSVERLRAVATDAGLVVREVRRWPAHDYLESPAEAIAKIESRSYSILWRVPDDEWREAARPSLEALRALPDPDQPIRRASTDPAVVLERPA